MDTEVTLTVREQKRLYVITEVMAGRWTASPRKRRPPRHRRWRERSPHRGMLLQIDGSQHKWLEDRGQEYA
jgi:hypothetical protein